MKKFLAYQLYIVGFSLLVGLPSFLAGVYGPLLLAPEANQGPLIGIFITGPAGIIIGAIVGLVMANRKLNRPSEEYK